MNNPAKKHPLQVIIETNFYKLRDQSMEIEPYNYSGVPRLSVSMPISAFGKFINHLVVQMLDAVDSEEMSQEDYERACNFLERCRYDAGIHRMSVYFPGVPYVESDDDSDDE